MDDQTFTCGIEIRESKDGPGRLVGTIMKYGERAKTRAEVFAPGSLEFPPDGIVINRQHVRGFPIMRVQPEVRGAEIVIDAPLPDTMAGREAATEIRNGLLVGLSVEFRARRQHYIGGVRTITSAFAQRAGLVDDPDYGGKTVEVRDAAKVSRLWL